MFESIVSDTGTAGSSYTDNTVEAGRSYIYRVRASNSHGMGPRSTYHRVEVPRPDDGTRAVAIDMGDATRQDSVVFRDYVLDGSSDTVDYYTFELTVTRHMGLGLRQQDANADLYVEDSEGTVLFKDENTGTADEWISEDLRSGTYFIRVEAKESGRNEYKLRYGVEAVTQEQQQLAATPTPNSAATGKPTITGTVQVGETLTAGTSGISDGNGMTSPGFAYQWLHSVDGTDTYISGATGSAYVLVSEDQGHRISVRVGFSDDDGYWETVTSDATSRIP